MNPPNKMMIAAALAACGLATVSVRVTGLSGAAMLSAGRSQGFALATFHRRDAQSVSFQTSAEFIAPAASASSLFSPTAL